MTNLPNWMDLDENHVDVAKYRHEMENLRTMLQQDVCFWKWACVEDKAGLVFTGHASTDNYDGSVWVDNLPLSVMLDQLTAPERIKFADNYYKYIKTKRVWYTTQEDGWATFSDAINYGEAR